MQVLHDSHGRYIAVAIGDFLFDRRGRQIGGLVHGHICIDKRGRYLGEIVQGRYLLASRSSGYASSIYGMPSPVAGIAAPASANVSGIAIAGYTDVELDR